GARAHSHSYPTRRSSDLTGLPTAFDMGMVSLDGFLHPDRGRAREIQRFHIAPKADVPVLDRREAHGLRTGWEQMEIVVVRQKALDRKSTRLNSSHQITSY